MPPLLPGIALVYAGGLIPLFKPVISMPASSPRVPIVIAVLAAALALSTTALAQQLLPNPAAPAPARARPAAVATPRAASCHNGQSFDRFLAELKQKAVAAGVSQATIAAVSYTHLRAHET